jgi:rRNA maturation endonuclease Nob1
MEVQLLQAQLQKKELTNKLARLDIPADTLKKTGMIGEQSEQSKLAYSMQKICRHCKAVAQKTSRFCHICGGSEFTFQSPTTE